MEEGGREGGRRKREERGEKEMVIVAENMAKKVTNICAI